MTACYSNMLWCMSVCVMFIHVHHLLMSSFIVCCLTCQSAIVHLVQQMANMFNVNMEKALETVTEFEKKVRVHVSIDDCVISSCTCVTSCMV